jgi:hypothetical protein
MNTETNDPLNEVVAIAQWLQDFMDPANHDKALLPEILWSSLHAMKTNPEISVLDAIDEGINEWIK